MFIENYHSPSKLSLDRQKRPSFGNFDAQGHTLTPLVNL